MTELKTTIKVTVTSILIIAMLISSIVLAKILQINTSIAIDNVEPIVKARVDKYINYNLEEQKDTGTLVQYKINTGIKYGENQAYASIRQSELDIAFKPIDNKFPSSVKVIEDNTKATNGDSKEVEIKCAYNRENGKLIIVASNEKDGNVIYKSGSKDDEDEYTVICYYDTFTQEKLKREAGFNVSAIYKMDVEENNQVSKDGEFKQEVTENIGELTSVETKTEDIYNGYIKANIINGTEFGTEYKEKTVIGISKKEQQEKLVYNENNTIIKTYKDNNQEEKVQDLGNNGNLVYKSTKLIKEDIKQVLGEDGKLSIFNTQGNLLAEINKDTQYAEDGTFTIKYENEPEGIVIQTSKILNEGYIKVENLKEIKSTMKETENIKVKTLGQLAGIKEEKVLNKVIFSKLNEITNEIKDATTHIDATLNNEDWTNEKQNELEFNVKLKTNSLQYNLFKNPTIKIELPKEVEKVIINEGNILYGNGIALQSIKTEQAEDGSISIIAELIGTQAKYEINELGLDTILKVNATVILKKDIESTDANINLECTNEFTLHDEIERVYLRKRVQLKNYTEANVKQEPNQVVEGEVYKPELEAKVMENPEEPQNNNEITRTVSDDIRVEVNATKGTTPLNNEDIVYEGEFIKYNIQVSNTTDADMQDVKLKVTIPEGLTYTELEAEYFKAIGKYAYKYDETAREKIIEVGEVKANAEKNLYYEVKVNNLENNQTSKTIETNINAYKDNIESQTIQLRNTVNKADVQIFMGASLDHEKDGWNYKITVKSDENKTVNAVVNLPEYFDVEYLFEYNEDYDENSGQVLGVGQVVQRYSEENRFEGTVELDTNRKYNLRGKFDCDRIIESEIGNNDEIWLTATTEVTDENNHKYTSNENRILFSYNDATIYISSPTEGEEVAYGDEIVYEITAKYIRKTNLDDSIYSYLTLNVTDFLPEDVIPQSLSYVPWIAEETEETAEDDTIDNPTGRFYQGELIEKDISSKVTYESGETAANINEYVCVPYGQSVVITVKAKAGFVTEKTRVENSAGLTGTNIKNKVSNSIVHYIMPKYEQDEDSEYEEFIDPTANDFIDDKDEQQEEPNDDDNNQDEDPNDDENNQEEEPNDDENNQEEEPNDDENNQNEEQNGANNDSNIDNSQDSENTSNTDNKYSISGVAWLDENKDGQRQNNEPLLEGITVYLVDMSGAGEIAEATTTNNSGEYIFTEKLATKYLIVFKFDNNKYAVTESKSVSGSVNSDATAETITLNGEEIAVGVTDIFELNMDLRNIDIGLINKSETNKLAINKYIKKITTVTKNKKDEREYNNVNLAKSEIKAKEVEGATVEVNYIIEVKNEANYSISGASVIDYIPDGFEFVKSKNSNWSQNDNGKVVNTSLINKEIKPGETHQLSIVLTKTMTENSTGTFTNKAEINGASSKADVIISISTGLVKNIIIFVTIVTISVIIGVLNYKFGILKFVKIGVFVLIISTLLLSSEINTVEAFQVKDGNNGTIIYDTAGWDHLNETTGKTEKCYARYDYYSGYKFYGGPTNVGWCQDDGLIPHGICNDNYGYADYVVGELYQVSYEETSEMPKISLRIENEDGVETLLEGNYCIFGPFSINYSATMNGVNKTNDVNITKSVFNNWGEEIDYQVIRENTNNYSTYKIHSFYIKVHKDNCKNGVRVKAKAKIKGYEKVKTKVSYQCVFYASDNHYQNGSCQRVKTDGSFTELPGSTSGGGSGETETEATIEKEVEWERIPGIIEVIKQDADDENVKLQGVELTIEKKGSKDSGYTGTKVATATTNENGVAIFENLKLDKNNKQNKYEQAYYIRETNNPNTAYEFIANEDISHITADSKKLNMGMIVHSGVYRQCIFTNTKKTGNLLIEKKDADSGKAIENVGFKIYSSSQKNYIRVNNSSELKGTVYVNEVKKSGSNIVENLQIEYTTKENATEFKTDSSGKIQLYNIFTGTYYVTETSAASGYKLDSNSIAWKYSDGITEGETTNSNRMKVKVHRAKSYKSSETSTGIITDGQKTIEDGVYRIYVPKEVTEPATSSSKEYAFEVQHNYPYNRAKIRLYENNNSMAQRFYFSYKGNGNYTIRSLGSNKVVDVKRSNCNK